MDCCYCPNDLRRETRSTCSHTIRKVLDDGRFVHSLGANTEPSAYDVCRETFDNTSNHDGKAWFGRRASDKYVSIVPKNLEEDVLRSTKHRRREPFRYQTLPPTARIRRCPKP